MKRMVLLIGVVMLLLGCGNGGDNGATPPPGPPTADFEATPTNGAAPLVVNFTDLSTGSPTSWSWDFGDGVGTSTEQNPSYTYNSAGWFTVTLTVTNASGSDTEVKEMYILVANNVWFVDGTVATSGDGTDWTTAFKTISEGITAAGDYDLVFVADGTYTGAGNKGLDFAGKEIYLKGVDRYGGGSPVIDCENSGRGFYFHTGETSDAVVDNFTIQNGRVSGSSNGGGGIRCYDSSSATIKNCIIQNNTSESYGGGLYCGYSSSMMIVNTVIKNNTVTDSGCNGGGVACIWLSSLVLENCRIEGNVAAGSGGGVSCSNSDLVVKDCIILSNTGDSGGGIHFSSSSGTLLVENCAIESNSTSVISGGGGISIHGVGGTIRNCVIRANRGKGGAGVYCSCDGGAVEITNCLLVENIAGSSGQPGIGGGAYLCQGEIKLVNCTVSGNQAVESGARGGGVCCNNSGGTSSATLNNCIVWGNSSEGEGNEIYVNSDNNFTVNYSDVDDDVGDIYGVVSWGSGIINDDPLFVDAASGDYHLQATSPCIDAGDNSYVPSGVTTDLDGNPRITDGDGDTTATVDIGAFEYW